MESSSVWQNWSSVVCFFFFQAEDGIRDFHVTGVQTCALPIWLWLELDAILAVVIGGASLMGGRFSLVLSIIGALIIQTLTVTIIMSGIPPKFNLLIKASAIILVLLMQSPRF